MVRRTLPSVLHLNTGARLLHTLFPLIRGNVAQVVLEWAETTKGAYMTVEHRKKRIPQLYEGGPSPQTEGVQMKTIGALVIVASVLYILLVLLRFT